MYQTSYTIHALPLSRDGWWRQGLWISLTVILTLFAGAASSVAAEDRVDPLQLTALSQQLIDSVKSGKAEATEFRTQVVFYRESLRSLMLANETASSQRFASDLLMRMVRMAALLQSAAECQTGRYISCPVNLLHELEQQQHQLKLAVSSASTSP